MTTAQNLYVLAGSCTFGGLLGLLEHIGSRRAQAALTGRIGTMPGSFQLSPSGSRAEISHTLGASSMASEIPCVLGGTPSRGAVSRPLRAAQAEQVIVAARGREHILHTPEGHA